MTILFTDPAGSIDMVDGALAPNQGSGGMARAFTRDAPNKTNVLPLLASPYQ